MGSKVQRFYYVAAPTSAVVHRFYGNKFVEGEKTACGVRVHAGWPYWLRRAFDPRRICARCEAARA